MKLSEQVITLEQAQKLEELGIKQESAFYHVHNGAGWQIMPEGYFMVDPEGGEAYAAFTVSEVIHILGMYSFSSREECGYAFGCGHITKHLIADSLGESSGNLLIELVEQGKVTINEINRRF